MFMNTRLASVIVVTSVMALGCGDDGSSRDTERGDSQGDGIGTGDSNSDDGESASGSGDSGTTNGEDGTTTSGTTTSGTTGPGTTSTTGTGGDGGPKWDLGGLPDGGAPGCGGEGDPEFSYLWAANSSEGTISKIDTATVLEVGRYQVRPDGQGSPSRTSVSLSGHAAVASRNGGVTKFYANEEECQDTNGTPGIQTSLNNTALAWDQEECRAWHTPFTYTSQRPLAWAPGIWNPNTCAWEDEMLWTAGRYGQGDDEVIMLDGETGEIVQTIPIPGLKADSYGIYGAAVDSEGNFWGTGWATGNHLVRVDRETFEVSVWDGPTSAGASSHWYGMTVDVDGYVWNCASRLARFDPTTEMWTVSGELEGGWTAGCMADAEEGGLIWLGSTGVRGVDRETFEVIYNWPTPTSYGVSIDPAGFIWAVNGNGAHRVEPTTGVVTSYNGLVGAYTYSDMTGAALKAVGGTPSN